MRCRQAAHGMAGCAQTLCCWQGLRVMRQQQVVGPLLAAAALREFHRLVDDTLAARDWQAANHLYGQVLPVLLTATALKLDPSHPSSCCVVLAYPFPSIPLSVRCHTYHPYQWAAHVMPQSWAASWASAGAGYKV